MPRWLIYSSIGIVVLSVLVANSTWIKHFPFMVLRATNIRLIPLGEMHVRFGIGGGTQQLKEFEDYKLLERLRGDILQAAPGSLHSCIKDECLAQFPALTSDDVSKSLLIVEATPAEVVATARSKSSLHRTSYFGFLWRSGKPNDIDIDFTPPKVQFMWEY